MTGVIEARNIRRVGLSSDGRANVYEWACGKCGTRGDAVDDFMGPIRVRQCPRFSCSAENRIVMGSSAGTGP